MIGVSIGFLFLMLFFLAFPVLASDDWKIVWQDELDKKSVDGSKWNFVQGGGVNKG
jgi:hypothetical protein